MMKIKITIASLITVIFFTSCNKEHQVFKINNQQGIANSNYEPAGEYENSTLTSRKISKSTVVTFENREHNFGKIIAGDKVTYKFKFKNIGNQDLIISHAKGSCGCTVPEYPKNALKPEENGEIKVSFNSEGKSGDQIKTVTLYANTLKGAEILTIKATIVAKK